MNFRFTEVQEQIIDPVRKFVDEEVWPRAREYDLKGEFPWPQWEKLAKMGYLGLPLPEEHGGRGADHVAYIGVVEELSRGSAALALSYAIHIALVAETILKFGSEEQVGRYVPALARGEKMGAFALTEPGAGTDAAAQKTRALRDGDHYVLNGEKCFITGGALADVFIVTAVTDPSAGSRGISAFIVEKGLPGFEVGEAFNKMGLRASVTNRLYFKDCRVPAENLLGQEGQGFKMAMAALDGGRIGIAAQAVGIARAALDLALDYAKRRQQFGKPLASFQAIQWMLAEMAAAVEAARLLTYRAAAAADEGVRFSREAAMAKLVASDTAVAVTRKAVQILGGYGYMVEYDVERLYRDAKITEIYEGTSEVQKMVIAASLLR